MEKTSHFVLVFLMSALLAVPAAGQVKVRVAEDGSIIIYNEAQAPRPRPAPAPSVSVPAARLEELIDRYARENTLEPRLVHAVIRSESGYNAAARSVKGAMGLMQLMPATATELGVVDAYDPEENIRGGTVYLRRMLDRFEGDLVLALAGYNAGPEAVAQYGGIPPYAETRDYVQRVVRLARGDAAVELPPARRGRRTHVTRDSNGRIVITTRKP